MKVVVVCDDRGKIIAIGRPGGISDKSSGVARVGAVPGSGHRVHDIDLPKELEKIPLPDIHKGFRVDLKGKHPRLVQTQDHNVKR